MVLFPILTLYSAARSKTVLFLFTTEDGKLAFARASQLPGILEAEKQTQESESKQLHKDKETHERHFWDYYQVCVGKIVM